MSTRNPLIADNDTYQTLHNVSCVVSYLQDVKTPHESEPTDDFDYGLWLLNETIRGALEYEKERIVEQRKARYKGTLEATVKEAMETMTDA